MLTRIGRCLLRYLLCRQSGLVDLSARDIRKRIIDALVERLLRLSERAPVILLIEDLQWSDPSTRRASWQRPLSGSKRLAC